MFFYCSSLLYLTDFCIEISIKHLEISIWKISTQKLEICFWMEISVENWRFPLRFDVFGEIWCFWSGDCWKFGDLHWDLMLFGGFWMEISIEILEISIEMWCFWRPWDGYFFWKFGNFHWILMLLEAFGWRCLLKI